MTVYVVMIILPCVALYAWLIEPMMFLSKETKVPLNGKKMKLLFVSDLHLGRGRLWMRYKKLLSLIEKTKGVDAILLGGDYLDSDIRYLPQLELFLARLTRMNVPMYAVLGDHDHKKIDPECIRASLKKYGVHFLEDDLISLGSCMLFGAKELRFDSVYDVRKMGKNLITGSKEKIKERVRELHPTFGVEPLIVLSHNPDAVYFQDIPAGSLVLAGHTHGGQVWPLTWMGDKTWRFVPGGTFGSWSGQKSIEGKNIVISNGAGCSALPFRLGCRPDYWVIETE